MLVIVHHKTYCKSKCASMARLIYFVTCVGQIYLMLKPEGASARLLKQVDILSALSFLAMVYSLSIF